MNCDAYPPSMIRKCTPPRGDRDGGRPIYIGLDFWYVFEADIPVLIDKGNNG